MLSSVRQKIINNLWQTYYQATPQMQIIKSGLKKKEIPTFFLDHFAIIDLPSAQSGIKQLKQLFLELGYTERGKDYLSAKQNDFLWLAPSDSELLPATDVLPQVVVADFRLEELPYEVKRIVEKYSRQTAVAPLNDIAHLANCIAQGNHEAETSLITLVNNYLAGRDWPLPTVKEFNTVQEFNELIAWVLVFGRRPNHFTLSIHLFSHFLNLEEFNQFVEHELQLDLNQEGGKIKGGISSKLAQSSTTGQLEKIQLSDGMVELPTGFVEFVWRYPKKNSSNPPLLWDDYFTGFIANHADHIIESLYLNEKKDNLSKVQG